METINIKVFELQDYIGYLELTFFKSRRRLRPGQNVAFSYLGRKARGTILEVGKSITIGEVQ